MAQPEVAPSSFAPVWEDVVCPACPKGTETSLWYECGDRFREPALKNYRVVRCSGCGLGYLSPRLSTEATHAAHREEGYDPFLSLQQPQSIFDRAYSVARRFTLSWKSRLIRKLVEPDARIVDGGCGTGEFLESLKDTYRVSGYEPEPNAARWARERLGLDVFSGSLAECLSERKIPEGSVDLMTLWHVLEHVSDPRQELLRLRSLLNSTGKLLVAVPNIASLDARIYGSAWAPLDAPRHLWHFTPSSLVNLAKITGFKLQFQGGLPLDPFYNAMLSEQLLCRISPEQRLFSFLRLPAAVAGSIGYGVLTGNHSSVYYVFDKA